MKARIGKNGFTLFELIVVIIIVSVLAWSFLGRFLTLQEAAEKAAMEYTVGAIRSALNIQLAGLMTRGRMQDLPLLAAENPFNFLSGKQKNYVGEFYDAQIADIPRGSWYFDLKHKQLVYLVWRGTHFVPDAQGNKWVRFQVNLVYNDALRGAALSPATKEIGGITLEEVQPYRWVIE